MAGMFLLEIKAIVLMTVLLAKYSHKKWADSPKICVHYTDYTAGASQLYKYKNISFQTKHFQIYIFSSRMSQICHM